MRTFCSLNNKVALKSPDVASGHVQSQAVEIRKAIEVCRFLAIYFAVSSIVIIGVVYKVKH
jgi:hypothetical protein